MALLALAVLLGACGEEGSTEVAPAPARLVAVSPALDSVTAGQTADPPVAVRVENALGDPVEGIPVRFLLATGGGELVQNLAVSNRQGIAEVDYRADRDPGEARVRADIPSASQVRALEFTLVTRPVAVVSLGKTSGDAQRAETGSQLPRPFVVRATTSTGTPAGGVAIAWSVQAPGRAAYRLTADTAYTGAEGRAQVLLTLGREAGEYVVRAHAAAGVLSDTVAFSVTASDELGGAVRLDSVRPLPLKAGGEAFLYGRGFSIDPAENEVRVEGEVADVLEASGDRLRVLLPAFSERCLPFREVGVRAIAAGEPGNGLLVDLEPVQTPLDLAIGEARSFRGAAEVGCLQLAAAESAREVSVIVQSAARTARSSTGFRLRVSAGPSGPAGAAASARVKAELDAALRELAEGAAGVELRLRDEARRELQRRRAVPARIASPDVAGALRGADATEGDTLRFRFAVQSDLTASCADTTNRIEGVVRAAGRHFLLVEDLAAPAPGFSADAWARLSRELDEAVYPSDTLLFGGPADIDGNGRVIALFTPQVNRLTPPGAQTGIGGFFLALDLAASGSGGGGVPGDAGQVCPASNEGEILYLATADPEGRFSDPLSTAGARRNALGISAHELQHLINAQGRVLGSEEAFDALEEVWLDEGLAHLAEEAAGLRMAGLGSGQNLRYEHVTTDQAALELFNAFHINNFFQLSLFMLEPGRAPALASADPGGLDGLQMRGFAWMLVRYLADQDGSPGGRQLLRRLASGGPNRLQGVANVETATGRAWADLLADFAVALAVDDAGVEGVASRHRIESWNLRDIYAGLNGNPSATRRFPLAFPLAASGLRAETAALDFELRPATARYFTLGQAAPSIPLALGLGSLGGGNAAEGAAPQVTVIRTR